jgi:hypothetical protein
MQSRQRCCASPPLCWESNAGPVPECSRGQQVERQAVAAFLAETGPGAGIAEEHTLAVIRHGAQIERLRALS